MTGISLFCLYIYYIYLRDYFLDEYELFFLFYFFTFNSNNNNNNNKNNNGKNLSNRKDKHALTCC